MTSNTHDDRCDLPLAPDADHNLTTEEVRLLWSFIHGDIMNEPTRVRLRKHWGLCGRHAWGSAVAEIELWQSGAGHRGGHQPFDAAVLYDDLLGTMVQALVNSRTRMRRSKRKVLAGKGDCIICDDVRAPALPGMALTHGGFTESVLADEANALTHTREWLVASAPVWASVVCPACAAAATSASAPASASTSASVALSATSPVAASSAILAASPAAAGAAGAAAAAAAAAGAGTGVVVAIEDEAAVAGTLCRIHLVEHGQVDVAVTSAVIAKLLPLRFQVRALADSMTQRGAPSTPEVDASWVQAMGWFHGWGFPLAVVATANVDALPREVLVQD